MNSLVKSIALAVVIMIAFPAISTATVPPANWDNADAFGNLTGGDWSINWQGGDTFYPALGQQIDLCLAIVQFTATVEENGSLNDSALIYGYLATKREDNVTCYNPSTEKGWIDHYAVQTDPDDYLKLPAS
ncbi:hypothetical protein K8I61_16050 [bacterium]|nr:hypothetical protein [bacterium]